MIYNNLKSTFIKRWLMIAQIYAKQKTLRSSPRETIDILFTRKSPRYRTFSITYIRIYVTFQKCQMFLKSRFNV